MKKLFLVLLLLGGINIARAQSEVEADLSLDFVSSYVWRGMYQGSAALQPEVSLGWKGLELSAWGSTGLADDLREIDLTLSYTIGGLTLSVVDYWCNTDTTGHCFEGAIAYDFGPVKASWQTFFAGNDYQEIDGRRAFSSYLEISAPFQLGGLDWEATVGMVPWASDYYESEGFSLNCLSLKATKNIPITEKFVLPLYCQLVANPNSQNFYFVAGFTITKKDFLPL